MERNLGALLVVGLFALACNLPDLASNPLVASSPTPIPSPTATPKPPDLSHQPLYWFAPLPPQPGGPYNGSDDFMDLFLPEAKWTQAAAYIQVYKLYGGWAARDSSLAQLRQAVQAIRQRGLALAVELGPLNQTDECGLYIEGFAGEEGVQTVQRIKAAGGTLNLIAFDEPYYYGHFYDGERACHWTAEKIAGDINTFIQRVRSVFPGLIVGDIEPLTGPADAEAYNAWLDTFRAVNGYDLAFLHLDVDWSNTTWPQEIRAVEEYGNQIGVCPPGSSTPAIFRTRPTKPGYPSPGSASSATKTPAASLTTSSSNLGMTSRIAFCRKVSRIHLPALSRPILRISLLLASVQNRAGTWRSRNL